MSLPQTSFLLNDLPLEPGDLPSPAEFDRLMRQSEQAVFEAAFTPADSRHRSPAHFRNEDAEIFASIWKDF
jgi:hypothetical protein